MATVRAIAFDCFYTLIELRWQDLPTIEYQGAQLTSTSPAILKTLHNAGYDDITIDQIHVALVDSWRAAEHDRVTSHVELPAHQRFGEMLRSLGIEPEMALVTSVEMAHANTLLQACHLMEGVEETVSELYRQGFPLLVASNFDRTQTVVDAMKQANILNYFDDVLVSESVGYCKPSPHIFNKVISTFNMAPEHIMFVGDQLNTDMHGALAAGMYPVWLGQCSSDAGKPCPSGVIEIDTYQTFLSRFVRG